VAWTPLSAKNVHLLAYLLPAAGATAPQVLVDNVQGQYRLLAANTDLNGLVVDQMVDQAGATGFLITPKISYGSVLTTAGVTTDMFTRWLALGGRPPIDDVTLRKAGVYGFTVEMSFRLLVRNPGDTGWHRRTVDDQLTVPVGPFAASTSPSTAAPTS
jgi:hypothetical protein